MTPVLFDSVGSAYISTSLASLSVVMGKAILVIKVDEYFSGVFIVVIEGISYLVGSLSNTWTDRVLSAFARPFRYAVFAAVPELIKKG